MFLDTTVVAGQIDDPEEVQGCGQGWLGAAPDGRAPRQPNRWVRHRHPANAENKEAAFLLMQWLTSKEGDKLVRWQAATLRGSRPMPMRT